MLVLVLLACAIGFLFATHWFTGRETVEYVWDSTVENTSGVAADLFGRDGMHRGVSLMAREEITPADVNRLVQTNVEWIAVHPYGLQPHGHDRPAIEFDESGVLGWGIRDSTMVVLSTFARDAGLRILLKPHLWLGKSDEGKWRSEIAMNSEEDWTLWFENYALFILHYAEIAELLDVQMFCIGTELMETALQREEDWRTLIAQVREIYSGELTYAANWYREYEEIQFWDALDVIGVQAYFPLTEQKNPSVETLVAGWQEHKTALQTVSARFDKPVIFTEIGYKSVAGAAIEPWAWVSLINMVFDRLSVKTQAHAYSAFFDVFWDEPWFRGAYLWRWTRRNDRIDLKDRSFYFQNKPAQNIVAKRYARISTAQQ
ncbi:MAG: hypothetical protein AB8G77_17060 [Rhodothermales bacterium]